MINNDYFLLKCEKCLFKNLYDIFNLWGFWLLVRWINLLFSDIFKKKDKKVTRENNEPIIDLRKKKC